MEKNNKININIHIFIFLVLILLTVINDIFIFLTKIEYHNSLLFSSITTIILLFILKKHFEIKTNFNKMDILPIVFIILLSLFKSLSIDTFVDTITYHLFNQTMVFADKINFDFLPSSSFFFPLGDRLNYLFVNFLGIRFGTILNSYTIIILYYQIKQILNKFTPNISKILFILSVLLIITSTSVAIYIGTYFIDMFSAVLLFQLVCIFIENINMLKNKKYLYLVTFTLGCLVGIKITNLFLGLAIIILLLIKNLKQNKLSEIKNIKFYDYIFLLFLFIMPFLVYMINNYIQTKNPIFPLFNNIFNSPYYLNVSGADERLGPKSIIEYIFWPIIISIQMNRGDDIYKLIEPTWALGFILSIFWLVKLRKNNKDFNYFLILTIIFSYTWTIFISGYARYGLVLSFCYYIVVIYTICNINFSFKGTLENLKFFLIQLCKIILLTCFLSIFISVSLSYFSFYLRVIDTYRNAENNITSSTSIPYNIDGVWLCSRFNNYYTNLIRHTDDPMYNIDILTPVDPQGQLLCQYSNFAKQELKEKLKNKEIYLVIPSIYENILLNILEQNDMMIVEELDTYHAPKTFNQGEYLKIVTVEFYVKN